MCAVKPILHPYCPPRFSEAEMLDRGRAFYQQMSDRRSLRSFSDEPVPREAIELAIATASAAPSGANLQPWRFVVVDDPELKRAIRLAAEQEEREFYDKRAPSEWLEALAPIGTDWRKPFLERAPYLIVVFKLLFGEQANGARRKHYYVSESVGLACGLLLASLQQMGLCTLTHTPSPMGFLTEILERPNNEQPFLLIPVGFAAGNAKVPRLPRKALSEVLQYNRP